LHLPIPWERRLFIGGLFFFAFWLLVALPFLYSVPRYSGHDEAANTCSVEESKNHGFWEKASCDPTAYFTLWLVAFTGVLAVSTIGLWIVTWRGSTSQARDMRASIQVAQDAAKAAKRSADIADRLLTWTDRPWVDVRLKITGDLKFDTVEGCMMKIKLTLENIGKSPAIGLGFYVRFCPSISQAVESHREMVESTRYMFKESAFGHTRFPNDPLEIDMVIGATPAQIEAGIKESDSGLVEPYIVACAYYGLPTGGRFRHTSINKAIWIDDSDTRGLAPVGEYPVDKMSLSAFNTGETI
jgi:hypothetical protein